MDADLFIKKVPRVVKDMISREAFENRRSLNQEAIALLEEALLQRVGSATSKRKQIENLLKEYVSGAPAARAPRAVEPNNPAAAAAVAGGSDSAVPSDRTDPQATHANHAPPAPHAAVSLVRPASPLQPLPFKKESS